MGRFWDAFRLLTLIAIVWTLVLIGVGAYVRLSNAGLSCPGWPACSIASVLGNSSWP